MRLITTVLVLIFAYGANLHGEADDKSPPKPDKEHVNPYVEVQVAYRGIVAGMEFTAARKILLEDVYLQVDDSTRYGWFDRPRQHVLKASSMPYVKNIYYNFYTSSEEKNELFEIIVHLNPKFNNFYELTKTLRIKYGPALSQTETQVIWQDTQNPQNRIILSRPKRERMGDLTVKYMDMNRMEQAQAAFNRHNKLLPQVLKDKRKSELQNSL